MELGNLGFLYFTFVLMPLERTKIHLFPLKRCKNDRVDWIFLPLIRQPLQEKKKFWILNCCFKYWLYVTSCTLRRVWVYTHAHTHTHCIYIYIYIYRERERERERERGQSHKTLEYTNCIPEGVRSSRNQCPGYDSKLSDGEASTLDIWGTWSIPSLQLLPALLWCGMDAPQLKLFNI